MPISKFKCIPVLAAGSAVIAVPNTAAAQSLDETISYIVEKCDGAEELMSNPRFSRTQAIKTTSFRIDMSGDVRTTTQMRSYETADRSNVRSNPPIVISFSVSEVKFEVSPFDKDQLETKLVGLVVVKAKGGANAPVSPVVTNGKPGNSNGFYCRNPDRVVKAFNHLNTLVKPDPFK